MKAKLKEIGIICETPKFPSRDSVTGRILRQHLNDDLPLDKDTIDELLAKIENRSIGTLAFSKTQKK